MPKSSRTPSGPEGRKPVAGPSVQATPAPPVIAKLNSAKLHRTARHSLPGRRLNIPGKGRGK